MDAILTDAGRNENSYASRMKDGRGGISLRVPNSGTYLRAVLMCSRQVAVMSRSVDLCDGGNSDVAICGRFTNAHCLRHQCVTPWVQELQGSFHTVGARPASGKVALRVSTVGINQFSASSDLFRRFL